MFPAALEDDTTVFHQGSVCGPETHWSQADVMEGACGQKKKARLSLHILVMGDREADKMTLWQFSQEEASSHARGSDGGMDKQMLFITQGWWG